MSLLGRISCVITLVLVSYCGSAQIPIAPPSPTNFRQKAISTAADSIKLDTVSIVPNSFHITDIPDSAYLLDFVHAVLYWKIKPSAPTVTISYRVFPFLLNAYTRRYNYDSVVNNFYVKPIELNDAFTPSQKGMFDFGSFKAAGSFGRQIVFGNSQDAVLNSSLNLQLSGMLGESI